MLNTLKTAPASNIELVDVEECVRVFDAYEEFAKDIETGTAIFHSPIWRTFEIDVGGNSLHVHCVNNAWSCELHTEPGSLGLGSSARMGFPRVEPHEFSLHQFGGQRSLTRTPGAQGIQQGKKTIQGRVGECGLRHRPIEGRKGGAFAGASWMCPYRCLSWSGRHLAGQRLGSKGRGHPTLDWTGRGWPNIAYAVPHEFKQAGAHGRPFAARWCHRQAGRYGALDARMCLRGAHRQGFAQRGISPTLRRVCRHLQ